MKGHQYSFTSPQRNGKNKKPFPYSNTKDITETKMPGGFAPEHSRMRSDQHYPGMGGKRFALTNRAKYGVEGGGHDSHSGQSYPSSQSGNSFPRMPADRAKANAAGVALSSGGNYGIKGL